MRLKRGFTITELLIVIIVIVILASITIVSYSAVIEQSRSASVEAELKGAHSKIILYRSNKAHLPPSAADAGVNDTDTIKFEYLVQDNSFCLNAAMNGTDIKLNINLKGTISSGTCPPFSAGVTSGACFSVVASEIYGYYSNEDNNPAKPACPRDVIIPSKIDGATITAIEYSAMSGVGLTSVVIPETVTHIFDLAFSDNSIQRVTIPRTVTFIGAYAFTDNNLTSVTINANSVWGNPFDPGVTINYY